MNVVIGIQARMSSSRLPGKVLREINGKPLLSLMIKRVMQSKLCEKIVILTSDEESDDPIELLCASEHVDCYRGSLDNVLERYYHGCKEYNPKHVVRLTADCPLIDAELIDYVVSQHLISESDYTANCLIYTYPDGLDIEVFKFKLLREAHEKAITNFQKEHVTPYMRDNSNKVMSVENNIKYQGRWTVDYEEDFILVENIFRNFGDYNFKYRDIKELERNNPRLFDVNRHLWGDIYE